MISLDYTPALGEGTGIDRPDFSVRPLPLRAAIELYGDAASIPPGALPAEPNRSVEHADWHALWLAPRRWLLIAEQPDALRLFLGDTAPKMQAIDVSHARTGFRLEGSAVRTVLGKGTPLDLRPSRFGAGQCARTWCSGFCILLDHRTDAIDLYVATSQAASFWIWLQNASETL